jgi:hypothetical protein
MTFTVAGASTINATSPTNPTAHALPVPGSTSVDDLLVVGYWGGIGIEVTDARLTSVYRSGQPPYSAGAYGTATDLTDVTFDAYLSIAGIAIAVALTDYSSYVVSASAETFGMPSTDEAFSGVSGIAGAVVCVIDVEDSSSSGLPVDVSLGDDGSWTTEGAAYLTETYYTGYALKAYSYQGTGTIPSLTVASSVDAVTRSVFAVLFNDLAAGRVLRQRQSPRYAPSRVRPTDLRQRQTPYIT